MGETLVIGTRGSALARRQTELVRARIEAANPGLAVRLEIIQTRGDRILDRPLAEVGGKGLFIKEIEQALLDARVDLAVHSLKDMPAEQTPGLALVAIPERADPRDALCTRDGGGLDALPAGARVGTSSLRRRCQLLALRPDLALDDLRGNVDTRLRRLDEGRFDAVVLASAGLDRLGLGERASERLPAARLLPAAGQGALALEGRADDARVAAVVASLHHPDTAAAVAAERALLARLQGDCQVPVAAHAREEGGALRLDALVGLPDGSRLVRGAGRQAAGESPAALGHRVADEVLAAGGEAVLASLR